MDTVTRHRGDGGTLRIVDVLGQDIRYALRLMRKTPAFTATTLATIAICLGANLAIFAVVDAVLLRPLPFVESERLVKVFNTYPKAGVPNDGVSLTNYYERRGHIRALSSVAIHHEAVAIVGDSGSTEREPIARVSPEFFATLGVRPLVGRPFTEAETTFQTDGVAIVTDAVLAACAWRRHSRHRPPHTRGRRPEDHRWSAAGGLRFPVVEGTSLFPAGVES